MHFFRCGRDDWSINQSVHFSLKFAWLKDNIDIENQVQKVVGDWEEELHESQTKRNKIMVLKG